MSDIYEPDYEKVLKNEIENYLEFKREINKLKTQVKAWFLVSVFLLVLATFLAIA